MIVKTYHYKYLGGILMELKQLEYFIVLCQELHFTRAAEKLGIAQPSLSQQIGLLEHEVGMPLFDRIGKKIYLLMQVKYYSITATMFFMKFLRHVLQLASFRD